MKEPILFLLSLSSVNVLQIKGEINWTTSPEIIYDRCDCFIHLFDQKENLSMVPVLVEFWLWNFDQTPSCLCVKMVAVELPFSRSDWLKLALDYWRGDNVLF